MYTIKQVSTISKVSVRTLHHYDEIELLVPKKEENGYRIYSEEDIDKLQQILFYKVLGFKLNDIKKLLKDNDDKKLYTLLEQRELLKKEQEKLSTLLETLDKTIESYKGERTMSVEEKFEGFSKEYFGMYEEEAKEKYGEFAVTNAKKNIYDNKEVYEKWVDVFKKASEYKEQNLEISDDKVQEQIELLYTYMNKYAFDCSIEVFSFIGKGYVADERFRKNIDKAGEGTAEYISRAIEYYCEKNK